jgi:hypothetical protein
LAQTLSPRRVWRKLLKTIGDELRAINKQVGQLNSARLRSPYRLGLPKSASNLRHNSLKALSRRAVTLGSRFSITTRVVQTSRDDDALRSHRRSAPYQSWRNAVVHIRAD